MKKETIEKLARLLIKDRFTPGPWYFTLPDETSSGGVYGENDKCVCDIIPKELQVAYDCEEIPTAQANARLIAAAPELHAQCKLLDRILVLTEMEGGTDVRDELEKLREILAKVDGGEG